MAKGKAGATCKLTHQKLKRFKELLEKGLSNRNACKLCGINEGTFYNWIKDGELIASYVEKGNILPKEKEGDTIEINVSGTAVIIQYCNIKFKFFKTVREAEATCIEKLNNIVYDSAVDQKDVKSAMWLLERKDKKEYSTNSTVSIANEDGQPFKQEIKAKPLVEQLLEFKTQMTGKAVGNAVRDKYKKKGTENEKS